MSFILSPRVARAGCHPSAPLRSAPPLSVDHGRRRLDRLHANRARRFSRRREVRDPLVPELALEYRLGTHPHRRTKRPLDGDGWLDPPAGLRGPIRDDPAHPLQGNADRVGRQVTLAMGNFADPILKPWAADAMRQSNEEVLTGKRGMPFLATSRCYPGSVPGQLLWTTEPFFFFPDPNKNMVYMFWERNSLVRRIDLTDQHSENVTPTWFGELIGRYEGQELVVDTTGLKIGLSFIDMYRTPHSEKLHVTERFRLSADGRFLEVLVKVDDPDSPSWAHVHDHARRKQDRPWREFICAENNGDRFSHNLFPLPEAKTPDF